jgi:hypothetical protein
MMSNMYSNDGILSFMEHNTNKISSYAFIQLKLFLIITLFWSIIFLLSTYRLNITIVIDNYIQNTIDGLIVFKLNQFIRSFKATSRLDTLMNLMDLPRKLIILCLISIPLRINGFVFDLKETIHKIKLLIHSIQHFQAILIGHIANLLYLPVHISVTADKFRKDMMDFQHKAEQLIQIVRLPIEALVVTHKLTLSLINFLHRINPPRARLI